MPSALLREHQHAISDVEETDVIVFGTDDTGWLTTEYPTVTAGDQRNNDRDRQNESGVRWGRDYRGAKTYGFVMTAITDKVNGLGGDNPHGANLDLLDRLQSYWEDERWRDDPQAVALLRSYSGGRVTRCYGRPRRWDEAAGPITQQGYTPVVADFMLTDDRWYADVEEYIDLNVPKTSEGGFIAPIVAPIRTTLATTAEVRQAMIAGNRSTWPVVEFHGPAVDPSVLIDGAFTVGLSGTVPDGETITVDPRPWSRSVLRATDQASVGGMLSGATPAMNSMLLRPGTHLLNYTAIDVVGTSYARLRWRTARSRP